jgi:hypothetical protein
MRGFSGRTGGLAVLLLVTAAGAGQQPQAPPVTTSMVAMRDRAA